jgi:hypothetical protein
VGEKDAWKMNNAPKAASRRRRSAQSLVQTLDEGDDCGEPQGNVHAVEDRRDERDFLVRRASKKNRIECENAQESNRMRKRASFEQGSGNAVRPGQDLHQPFLMAVHPSALVSGLSRTTMIGDDFH